jgi:uncharacterized protein YcfJ
MNMKKNIIIVILLFFVAILSGCTAAQQGSVLGGLGGMAGSAIGKGDRKTTAISGAAGAAVGYMIGNEIDKQGAQVSTYETEPYYSPTQKTDCRKIVTRKTKDGVTTETIEEVCEGRKTTSTY